MDVNTLINRARSGLGKGTKYKSPGVTPPLSASTWPKSGGGIDCSGFMAWCLRLGRKVHHPKYEAINGGWFETTGIFEDVENSWGFFESIDEPRVGAFLVYPDHNGHEGHIGVVTAVNGGNGINGVARVIHCSSGGWVQHHDAIRETAPSAWLNNPVSRVGWYTGVTP